MPIVYRLLYKAGTFIRKQKITECFGLVRHIFLTVKEPDRMDVYSGVKGGGKSAVTLGAWTAAFVGLQEGIDRQAVARLEEARPFRKTLSGSIAGIAIAAVASGLCEDGGFAFQTY